MVSSISAATSKAEEISLILSEPEVDLWKLRELALSEGGLVNDTLRKRAWPKLVGLHSGTANPDGNVKSIQRQNRDSSQVLVSNSEESSLEQNRSTTKLGTRIIASCLDAVQIERDVSRCTWHLLTGSQRSQRRQMRNKHRKKIATLLRRKQRRLGNLINLTLCRSYDGAKFEDDKLRYYQGYHDVACVFLATLGGGVSPVAMDAENVESLPSLDATAASVGLDLPSRVLLQVSNSHFRDAMRTNFHQLTMALRLTILPLIGALDSEVHSHLHYCDMEPFFALSWIITWFSHDFRETELVKRLFDVFIVSHPLMPVYMSVAMVLHPINRIDVLATDCDFASVHNSLAALPKNSCSVGWKMVGGGYMSGDEDDEDATGSLDASFLSDDACWEGKDDDEIEMQSLNSSSAWNPGRGALVPVQDLIDMAISFMRRIPPRKLPTLARKYFTDPSAESMLSESSSIALLQPPPSWGLSSTAPSDWVLRQRLRELRGSRSSRRERRARSRDRSRSPVQSRRRSRSRKRSRKTSKGERASYETSKGECPDVSDTSFSNSLQDSVRQRLKKCAAFNNGKCQAIGIKAMIASGIGPDDDEEKAKQRRRRLLLWSGVAAALVSVTWALLQSGTLQMLLFKKGEIEGGGSNNAMSTNNGTCEASRTELKDVSSESSNSKSSMDVSLKDGYLKCSQSESSIFNLIDDSSKSSAPISDIALPLGPKSLNSLSTRSKSIEEISLKDNPFDKSTSNSGMGAVKLTEEMVVQGNVGANGQKRGPLRWMKSVFESARTGLSHDAEDVAL